MQAFRVPESQYQGKEYGLLGLTHLVHYLARTFWDLLDITKMCQIFDWL